MMVRLIIAVLILSSCAPQKRYERLVKKNPWLVEYSVDTQIVVREYKDTFYIPGDTTVFFLPGDTVITQGKVTAQRKGDSVYFFQAPDTLYRTDTIRLEIPVKGKIVKVKEPLNTALAVVFALLCLFFMLAFLRKSGT